MADPTPTPEPQPFNADALASTVQSAVKSTLQEMQAQATAQAQQRQQQAAQQQAAQRQQQQWQGDPVAATLRPYLEPLAQSMSLQVQAANDKADFYLSFPEALEHKGDVESMFGQLMQQGRPMEREAVWHYYKGKNAEAFAQKAENRKQAALDQAAGQHTTIGGPAALRPAGPDLDNFRALPLDQMRDALKGVSF